MYVNTRTANLTETQPIHTMIIDCRVSVNIRISNVVLIAEELAQQIGLTAEYPLSLDCHVRVNEGSINHSLPCD